MDRLAGSPGPSDREAAIGDNIEYVNRVIESVLLARHSAGDDVLGSPAVEAAAVGGSHATGRGSTPFTTVAIIAVGGDVPPELLADASLSFPSVLLARGTRDEWYSAAKLDADMAALTARGGQAESLVYDGGHEWTPDVSDAAGRVLTS